MNGIPNNDIGADKPVSSKSLSMNGKNKNNSTMLSATVSITNERPLDLSLLLNLSETPEEILPSPSESEIPESPLTPQFVSGSLSADNGSTKPAQNGTENKINGKTKISLNVRI